jgi:hypothetical protein
MLPPKRILPKRRWWYGQASDVYEWSPNKLLYHQRNSGNPIPTFVYPSFQPQLVIYLSTEAGDVNLSPRLYISKETWNEIRFEMKRIEMIPERAQQCSNSVENLGVPRCTTNAWLQQQLLKPFNCTFYPFHGPRTANAPTCDPITIIQNYDWIMKSHVSTTHVRELKDPLSLQFV